MPRCIWASSIAGLVGMHAYKKLDEAFEELWRKDDPESYFEAFQRAEKKTAEELVSEALEKHPEVRQMVDKAPEASGVAAGARAEEQAAHVAGLNLSAEHKKVLTEHVRKTAYCGYGTAREDFVFESLEDLLGQPCVKDPRFHTAVVEGVKIGGRVDGMTQSGDVVEIKNRVRRLFYRIPEYEKVQAHVYMVLKKTSIAHLVEHHMGKTHVSRLEFDPELWDAVSGRLRAVAAYLDALEGSPDLQDAYVSQTPEDKARMLAALFYSDTQKSL